MPKSIPPKPSGMEPELGTGSRSEEVERWYQAQDLYREAQVKLVRKDRPGAAKLLREALQRSPQHVEAKELLATIEEIEQQDREVRAVRAARRADRAEIQRRLEDQSAAQLSRGMSSIYLNGPLGIGVALTSGVLGMIGGLALATALVLLLDLGAALPYGGLWMMGPLAGGMFCGATFGLIAYSYLGRHPALAVVVALVVALLAGGVGGTIFPVVMLLLAIAGLLQRAYRLLRRAISRRPG